VYANNNPKHIDRHADIAIEMGHDYEPDKDLVPITGRMAVSSNLPGKGSGLISVGLVLCLLIIALVAVAVT
jgi:hypothetical protein